MAEGSTPQTRIVISGITSIDDNPAPPRAVRGLAARLKVALRQLGLSARIVVDKERGPSEMQVDPSHSDAKASVSGFELRPALEACGRDGCVAARPRGLVPGKRS